MRVHVTVLVGFLWATPLFASLRFSEVMYNPATGEEHEYLELVNTAAAPLDISGWIFTGGILFAFDDNVVVPPGGRVIVAGSLDDFLAAYPDLPEDVTVVGNFVGGLDNGGEEIELSDRDGNIQESFTFDDNPPWDFLADGFGASLERLCLDADANLPENWRAGRVPDDPETEFGGTPGAPPVETLCPPQFAERPPVFLSEILYRAVLEEAVEEEYEWVEIHNAGGEPVDLSGWRLAGGVDYSFPDGTSLAPGAYLTIAKSPSLMAPVWELAEADVLGPYARTLDNGGEKIAIIGADGQGIDSVNYDDEAPWPIAADALGASTRWLREELLPREDHRHKGYSLERVSFDEPAGLVANWEVSPLDGSTPNRANASARAELRPIALDVDARSQVSGTKTILADEPVSIEVLFSPSQPLAAEVEYFVEDIQTSDEPITTVPLVMNGELWTAALPALPASTIVRYRVRADRGEGLEQIAPRLTDPNEWLAYFVRPVIEGRTRVYHLFIAPLDWGQLGRNIASGRVSGCNESPTWNGQVPAIFVHGGRVADAFVRYQGSRWNRNNGTTIAWPPQYLPPRPGPARAMSWRIALPRYRQLEGRNVLTLNKLSQGCPGHNSGVGYRLFALADLPSPETRYIRLFINGGYFHYMMEYERPGEDLIRRYHREMAEKYPDRPREKVGHLFKSVGCTCDEGPYGWGDWRLLNPFCGHQKDVRYAATYDRKTHDWNGPDRVVELIEEMHRVRSQGVEAQREFILENFDFELLLNYIVIINWQVPFDDMFQNHFLYQRLSDGKWLLTPWDLDRNFGEWQGATSSVFMGRQGDPSNRSGWWHRLKDTVLRAFEDEYLDHLLLLNNTLLHPDNVFPLVDLVTAEASQEEANAAPARLACGTFAARDASFKNFVVQRHNFINTQVAGVTVDAGPDRTIFVGTEIQLDGSASQPPPGPDVTYSWSNGAEGAQPVVRFDEPGTHEVVLTVETRGIPFRDSVLIKVVPQPSEALKEANGLIVFEVENHFMNLRNGEVDARWVEEAGMPDFSGAGYMFAKSPRRRSFSRNYTNLAPELRYAVQFDNPGTYRVWIRAFAASTRGDSVYLGLNGEERGSRDAQEFVADETQFLWSGLNRNDEPQELTVEAPGLYVFSLWMRESEALLDKIVLSRNPEFTPAGVGPDPTGTAALDGETTFLRGDPNGDSKIDVLDGIAVLGHLFQEGITLPCEDGADTDDDGTVNLTDALGILNFVFLRGAPPRAPYPDQGFDPTPDSLRCDVGP